MFLSTKPKVLGEASQFFAALFLFFCAFGEIFSSANADEVKEVTLIRDNFDQCNPSALIRLHENESIETRFLRFSDEEQCSNTAIWSINHLIKNLQAPGGLVFRWDAAALWADRWNPLLFGHIKSNPIDFPCQFFESKLDPLESLAYSPNLSEFIYAPTYTIEKRDSLSADADENCAIRNVSSELESPQLLRASLRHEVFEDERFTLVTEADIFSSVNVVDKYTTVEVKSSFGLHSVAIGKVLDWMWSDIGLDAELNLENFVKLSGPNQSDAKLEVINGSSIVPAEIAGFVPKDIYQDRFLLVSGLGGNEYASLTFFGDPSHNEEAFLRSVDAGLANVMIFGEEGELIGNGRFTLYFPKREE